MTTTQNHPLLLPVGTRVLCPAGEDFAGSPIEEWGQVVADRIDSDGDPIGAGEVAVLFSNGQDVWGFAPRYLVAVRVGAVEFRNVVPPPPFGPAE